MNKKKTLYIILGAIGVVLLAIIVFFAVTIYPKLKAGKDIADALQPILEAENQSMYLDVNADINGELISLNTDIYLTKENDIKYMVLEQEGHPFYIVDNMLFLENGKAFLLGEEMQGQALEYEALFVQIAAVYDMFDITAVETDLETSYSVMVTGEQIETLLAAVMPTEQESFKGIETLQVALVTKEKKLDRIELSGKVDLEGTSVQIAVTIADFHILEEGEYAIPEVIKESVATVDKDSLFNLTQDLYRLIVALEPFSDMENIDGTVTMTVDCGLLQMNNTIDFSDLKKWAGGIGASDSGNYSGADKTEDNTNTESDTELEDAVILDENTIDKDITDENKTEDNRTHTQQLVPEESEKINLQQLPKIIGLLCMEGDISCTENGTSYVYRLVLDADFMKQLVESIVPEIVNYVVTLGEGSAELILEEERITSMKIVIKGDLNMIFTEVPMEIGAEFRFR